MKNKQTNIFLIRHGQTLWNEEKRWQGCQNSHLTSSGIQQAYETKKILDKYKIDKAYVSPLQRAQDTIKIILEDKDININVLDGLKEIKLGIWEGKTQKETAISHPKEFNNFWEHPESFTLQGAERFEELQKRVVQSLNSLFIEHEGENILVVSHWIAIKVALAYYQNLSLSSLPEIENPQNAQLLCIRKTAQNIEINPT